MVLNTFGYEIHSYIKDNWFRFLDDGFMFWRKSFWGVEVFVDILNELDPFLKFTHETSEQKISFLNVQVYKNGDKIETDVFYKKRITMTIYHLTHATLVTRKTTYPSCWHV